MCVAYLVGPEPLQRVTSATDQQLVDDTRRIAATERQQLRAQQHDEGGTCRRMHGTQASDLLSQITVPPRPCLQLAEGEI